MPSVGQGYARWLTSRERKALAAGCDLLIDHAFADIAKVLEHGDIAHTRLVEFLPGRYRLKYTPVILKQFAVCIITVAWKLAQPEPCRLSSVAEELAAWAIIKEARGVIGQELGKNAAEEAFERFSEELFDDTDFLFLFDNRYDGIDEGPGLQALGTPTIITFDWKNPDGTDEDSGLQALGITPLAFGGWFRPFSDAGSRLAHPLSCPASCGAARSSFSDAGSRLAHPYVLED